MGGTYVLGGEMLSLVEMRILLKFSPSLNRKYAKKVQSNIAGFFPSFFSPSLNRRCTKRYDQLKREKQDCRVFSHLRHETDLPPKDHHKCVCRHLLCNNVATLNM